MGIENTKDSDMDISLAKTHANKWLHELEVIVIRVSLTPKCVYSSNPSKMRELNNLKISCWP